MRFGIQRATVADIAKASGIRCREVVDAQTCIADGLVEGLLYAVGEGLADPYLRILLTPNEVDFTTTLVAASDLASP